MDLYRKYGFTAIYINSIRNVNPYYAKRDICRADINDHDC